MVELVLSVPREAASERVAPEVRVLPAPRRGAASEMSADVPRQVGPDAWALPAAQPWGKLWAARASEPASPKVWAPVSPADAS
ncbi:MAG: hypothetical protein ACREDC_09745 [Bradyrhizobium sp.]